MAEKELHKIVVLEPCTPAVEELLKKVEGAKQAELIRITNPEEAIQSVRQYQPCILVTCTINNADIPVRVNMLKKLESSIKSGVLKTLFVSKLKNRQLGSLITSLGVTDFIEEPVPARTLQFKTNLQLKAVETVKKQQELKKASQEKIVFKKSEAKQDNSNAVATETNAKRKPALSLEEDTFLFKNSGVKKVGKKTLVELEGPSPESGEWVPHEDKGDVKTSWRWVPNEKKDLPKEEAQKEGWVHEGEKPQFNEESGKWQFNSEKPDLSFQKKGEKVASKISTDESGEVVVAEDSPKAEENIKKAREVVTRKKEDRKKEDNRISKEKAEKKEEDQAATLRAINREKNDKSSGEPETAFQKNPVAESNGEEKKIGKKNASDLEDRLNRAMNKVGTAGDLPEESEEVISKAEKEETPEEAPKSPLDFLKKKREQKEKQKTELSSAKEDSPKKDGEVIALKSSEKTEEPTEEKEFKASKASSDEKPKKSAADAAKEALERMKRKVDAKSIGSIEKESDSEEVPFVSGKEEKDENPEDELKIDRKTGEKEKKERNTNLEKDSPEKNRETSLKKDTPVRMKPEERKAKKREILSKIQEVLNKPLPEKLSTEEEQSLRKELGLENKREITPRELAKRSKLNKVKELKEQLEELNGYVEDTPEFREHDLKKDEIENTWSQKGEGEKKKNRKINAYDSDSPELQDEDSSKTNNSAEKRKEEREKRPIEDRYVYLPENEVTPLGGAWESTGEYYIFLAATVRYKGFQKLDDLCPLLFYRGERIPELLDKTKQWRFLDRLPIRAERAADIPKDIRDFLFSLKAQAQSEEKKKIEEEKKKLEEQVETEKEAKQKPESAEQIEDADPVSVKKKESSKLTGLLEELENQAKELEEKSQKEADSDALESLNEESFEEAEKEKKATKDSFETEKKEKAKKEEKKSLKDLMASLEKEEAEQKEKFSQLEEEEAKEKAIISSSEEEPKKEDKTETNLIDEVDEKETEKEELVPESSSEEEAKTKSSESTFEEKNEDKKSNRSKESNDLESRLAALKSKLEDPFTEEEEKKSAKPETTEEVAPRVKSETPPPSEGLDNVKEKLKAGSEAIEKFLERRKQKKSKPAKESQTAKKDTSPDSAQHSPYLSVYLAVSNAFGSSKDPTKAVQRVLRSMEDAFGNCVVYIFFDKGPIESGTVEISSNGTGIGQKIPVSSGLACPIQFGVGSEEGSFLGYLFLKPSGTREFFTGAEEDAANKVAASLWSILVSREKNSEAKAA